MKSPGGMIEWSCPQCKSVEITGPWRSMGQKSGLCNQCGYWWPWRMRIKRRVTVSEEAEHG